MTVKELIEKLTKVDENKEVIASVNIQDEPLDQDCRDVKEIDDIVVIFTEY